ncbi:MAG: asparagine synthase (glutamine-hydrolyzing) [Candidatus Promineifilaceae bacterium]
MCGLVGIVGNEVSYELIAQANDALLHRGPDDAHCYVGAGVALAARRLSIVDLAHGKQPLCNEDGSVWITYNGEVFNAPDLRRELEACGHVFRTQTDTEVIVHAYEEWGIDAVGRLRGMFAFAIWDEPRRRLLIARDHFGIKPLYYAEYGGQVAFASEIRPIFHLLPTLPRQANHHALNEIFRLGYAPTPLTAFAGIHQLPAAHLMIVEKDKRKIQRYWQLAYSSAAEQQSVDPKEATAEFMRRLREVMGAWRMSDVPVGSLLSGGIDSSALAALLTESSGDAIDTFHIRFDAASHDESARARQVAEAIGSRHHELGFGSAEFDHLPTIINHLEMPQTSMTSIAIYLLYRACRDAGFKVIMTGEGADELLGGYHWFDGDRRVRPLLKLPQALRRQLARLPLPISTAGKRVLAGGNADAIARYALWHQRNRPSDLAQLLQHPATLPPLHTLAASLQSLAPLHQFLSLDTHGRMVDFINYEVDRMSMAASVEARPPFLDHTLWEWCAKLPPEVKLTGEGNKLLLRWGMRELLPKGIWNRPKQGLATPHSAWWRQPKLPAWAEEAIHASSLAETGYFNAKFFQTLRQTHQSGKRDLSPLLTGVLTTQLWHDAFL